MGAENFTSATEFILVGLSSHRKTQILLFIVILIIYLVTVTGNVVIIFLVWSDPSLHKPMYFFLSNLSSLEICYVTVSIPQMLAHLITGSGTISFARCAAQMLFFQSFACTECFLLIAMAYDRYLAICNPLIYAIAMGRRRQVQLASASWTAGFLAGTINVGCTLRLPFCGSNRINHFICEQPAVLKIACGDVWIMELVDSALCVPVVLIPISIILTSYVLIVFSVLQMQTAEGRRKAFSTCASHVAVVTLFYGPMIPTYIKPHSDRATDSYKQVGVFYIVVIPLLNPILYTLRNKDVHNAVRKVLQKWGFGQKSEH